MKKRTAKKRKSSGGLYPYSLTSGDAKQLEAKQRVIDLVNSNGMWPLLFTITNYSSDWLYILRMIERKQGKK